MEHEQGKISFQFYSATGCLGCFVMYFLKLRFFFSGALVENKRIIDFVNCIKFPYLSAV